MNVLPILPTFSKIILISEHSFACTFKGDYDPTKVKVLHFKMNPADIAATQRREELKRLQEENERLRQRVKLLEESEGKIEDLTVVVEKKLQEPGGSKDVEGNLKVVVRVNILIVHGYKVWMPNSVPRTTFQA